MRDGMLVEEPDHVLCIQVILVSDAQGGAEGERSENLLGGCVKSDIEKLEEKIQQIELKMTDVAFYEDPGHVKLLSELEDLKGQLKEKWKEWESISQELDEG